jgi:hypothetical protein
MAGFASAGNASLAYGYELKIGRAKISPFRRFAENLNNL